MAISRIAKISSIVALTAMVGVGLTACTTPTPEPTPTNTMVAPTIVDILTLNGKTVDIANGSFVDITTGEFAPEDYTAIVSEPTIVAFTAGSNDGTVVMNPGLEGTKVGTTQVELTNKTTGVKTTFTVVVK